MLYYNIVLVGVLLYVRHVLSTLSPMDSYLLLQYEVLYSRYAWYCQS